jgi:two-component system sensor histidine kinase/response regulator
MAEAKVNSELQAFIEVVPAGALLIDATGRITVCNQRLVDLFGYTREALLGQSMEILLPPELREGHRHARGPKAEGRPMNPGRVFVGQRQDGTLIELQIGLQPFGEGAERQVMAMVVDVTAERQMQRELVAAKEAAERANLERSDFLATLSHEIRTPLHAIVGTTGLLLEAKLEKNERELAETIQQACDSMLTLVSDILDFSKLESGELQLELIDFELYPLIEQVLEQVSSRAQLRALELSGFVPRHLPGVVRGDPGRLRQVLLHLLALATKFAERGELTVEVKKVDGPGLRLRFEIQDSGANLTNASSRFITTTFSKASDRSANGRVGSGLGIDLCRQVVGMMNGALGVDSVPGRGNRYWFEVQLAKPEGPTSRPHLPPDLSDARVLLVEDHPQARRAVSHLLASAGIQVEVAAGGQEAVARYLRRNHAAEPLSLILAGARLPDMDAVTLARHLEAATPGQCPRIVRLVPATILPLSPAEQALFLTDLKKPPRREHLYRVVLEALGRQPQKSPPAGVSRPARRHTEQRILVAEDNPVSQRVAARMIESLGYRVEVVADGHQAVAITAQQSFDLVLMDVQMPDMDGLTATREIRRREAKGRTAPLRIVAMTASAWTGDRERCLAAGMDDYLSKPVQANELDSTLRRWLGEGTPSAPPPEPTPPRVTGAT